MRDLFFFFLFVLQRRSAPHRSSQESSHCGSMHAAILQATAEMRAAPRPLPSSDWMKVMSQWGAKSRTILWNLSRKLRQNRIKTQSGSGVRGSLEMSAGRDHPPWVQLVDGAVDAHCDHQGVLAASLPHLVDDGGQAGAAHVGRARGDALAHQAHDVAVQL